jgi:hypothetical protein
LPRPADAFAGDDSIAADVTLGTGESRAQMSFRSIGSSAFTLSACPTGSPCGSSGDTVTTLSAGEVARVIVDGAAVTEALVTSPH